MKLNDNQRSTAVAEVGSPAFRRPGVRCVGHSERFSSRSRLRAFYRLKPGLRASAFTLLEIMVALALLSVVVMAIYSGWNAIVKGSRVGLDAAAASQRSRISMRTLQDALLSTCMFAQNGKYYGFVADTEGEFASLSFVARLPSTFSRAGRFDGVDVRRLNFTVESVGESKNCLVLRQYPLLLLEPDHVEEEHPLILARDVSKFILEFWDQKSGDWATEWSTTNRLPQMVRITLGLGRLDQYSSQPQELMFGVVALPAIGMGNGAIGGPGGPPIGGPGGVGGIGGQQPPLNGGNKQIPLPRGGAQ